MSFSGFSLAQDRSVQTYADIGFGVGSDISRQLMGVVQYALNSRWSLTGGWRHLDIDYDHKGFVSTRRWTGRVSGRSIVF